MRLGKTRRAIENEGNPSAIVPRTEVLWISLRGTVQVEFAAAELQSGILVKKFPLVLAFQRVKNSQALVDLRNFRRRLRARYRGSNCARAPRPPEGGRYE